MAKYNSVPLGQAGTGSAYVLGENTALPVFQRDIERQRLKREEQAQNIAKSYRDNILKASSGQLFSRELGDLEQKHIQQGYEFAKQGWDVYNPNPNNKAQMDAAAKYAEDRRTIENLRAYRKGIEDNFNEGNAILSRAVEGEYDPNIIAERNRMVSQGSLVDLYNRGATLPQLSKRFNPQAILKGVTAPTILEKETKNGMIVENKYLDKPTAENVVLSTIANQPSGINYLNNITGGLPFEEIQRMPNTLEEIKSRIVEDYVGSPENLALLAANQIKVGTPQFDALVNEKSQQVYAAKKNLNSFIDSGVNQISKGLNLQVKKTPEISAAQKQSLKNAEIRLAQSAERLRMAKTRFNERNDVKATSNQIDRQRLVDGMLNEVKGTGEEVGSIMKAKGGYQGNLDISKKNGRLVVKVPERVIEKFKEDNEGNQKVSSTIIPGKTLTFNKNVPADRVKLNELLNDITGEKVSLSKFNTGNPSGKITSNSPSVQTSTKTTSKGPVNTKNTTPKVAMVTMVLPNGQTGQIPSDKVADFMKKYPKAKRQ